MGGIYAYLMLQAFQLTDEKRFLDEARAAIRAAKGMRFELNYQANLTAWGAAACMPRWTVLELGSRAGWPNGARAREVGGGPSWDERVFL